MDDVPSPVRRHRHHAGRTPAGSRAGPRRRSAADRVTPAARPGHGQRRSSPSAGTTASTPPRRRPRCPTAPLLFAKFPSSVVGDGATITWSAALTARRSTTRPSSPLSSGAALATCPSTEALDYVLGYSCLNDVSARDLQVQRRPVDAGKSLDTFCPMGPWLVTADEIPTLAPPGPMSGERRTAPGRLDRRARPRGRGAHRLLLAVLHAGTGRRHRDRHARRRRGLPRPARLPCGRRRRSRSRSIASARLTNRCRVVP